MKITNSKQHTPSFNAQLLSQWRCHNAIGKARQVSIISIEKQDLDFIHKMSNNVSKYSYLDSARRTLIDASLSTIKKILEDGKTEFFKKTKMLMVIQNNKPCGFLIANVPKESPNSEKIVYSSRHNPAKNETEIDWLVTWNPQKNEKIIGLGKALVGEYFRTVKADKFRDVYVRAEIPELSYATDFYESVGFEKTSNKRTKLANKNTALYIVEDNSNKDDSVIPMIVTRSNLIKKSIELSNNMCRQEFVKKSIDINELVE